MEILDSLFVYREFVGANVVISLCSAIYSLILFSVVIFRPAATRVKSLWFLTGAVFIVESITRMLVIFVPPASSFALFSALNSLLACLLLGLSTCAWFQLDALFSYNLPESIRKEVVRKLKNEILECSVGEFSSSKKICELLDRLEKEKSFFT